MTSTRTLRPTRRTPTKAWGTGELLAREAALFFGRRIRAARQQRGWSQQQLADRIGISQGHVSNIERGEAAEAPAVLWYATSQALDVPLRMELGRDRYEEPADAGHLSIQELALRLGRAVGYKGTFELPTRPAAPAYASDVCLRDDRRRILLLIECWNTFGSINASIRSTRRKVAEAEALAMALGGDAGPYRVVTCWIVRDTRRNREIVAHYPEVFAAAFPGSSSAWVRVLTRGDTPPAEMGLVWCDLRASRPFAWRRPRPESG